jgi:choline kinase
VDTHREAFFVNFAEIRPPQAHLALSAELIGARSDFIKFHLTFENYILRSPDMNKKALNYSAVILAAGANSRLRRVTSNPKCLLKIDGKTLLYRNLENLHMVGIQDVVVVVGYRHELIREHLKLFNSKLNIQFVENFDYSNKNNGYSMCLGLQSTKHTSVVIDSDLIYDLSILKRFIDGLPKNKVLVGPGSIDDIECAKAMVDANGFIKDLVDKKAVQEKENYRFMGEAIGIHMFSDSGKQELLHCSEKFFSKSENLRLNWEHLINFYVREHSMIAQYDPSDRWFEIDTPEDYVEAKRKFESQNLK